MILVVIEGAGKKETIQKYLGSGYEVMATKGHIRDLDKNGLSVDIANNFEPKYVVMSDKSAIIKSLTAKAKSAGKVLLATDPDREGEAISWHVAHILDIDPNSACRIEFNEISKSAVQKALQNPRAINLDLVDAQQARRVLDRLVGYKVSPVISKKIQPKLSAGRVQSTTLELVVDREKEILAFVPEEYWVITALLNKINDTQVFKSLYYGFNGKKVKIENTEQKDKVLLDIKGAGFVVDKIKKSVTSSHAPAPYTTSTMQQDALNKLGMTLKRSSSAAQSLYEGVEIAGEGKVALVTYIRTDSVRVSPDAIAMAKNFIIKNFGADYYPETPNFYKSRKNTQDAHEAIRPINLSLTPESVKASLSSDNYRLYKIIYERFLASQMAKATYNSVTIDILANKHIFKTTGRTPLFAGYTKVYEDYKNTDNSNDDDELQSLIPELTEGEKLNLNDIKAEQKFTKPPARYTEASLVKAMEEKGIGRPATYVPTITLIANRLYTEKEGKYIKPTELGSVVCSTLIKFFPDIMNIGFTAEMEDKLDSVEEGGVEWQKFVAEFYKVLEAELKTAGENTEKFRLPVEESNVVCDKCGAKMVIRNGRYGKFLACPKFPECKNIKNLNEPVAKCPDCGKDVIARRGKSGKTFYGCTGYPNCKFISWDPPTDQKCPTCGGVLTKKETDEQIKYNCINKTCRYSRTEKKVPV
ncbi:MAG: type I DNA topoisomerase [Firmicutes bacterium]|nr:type I DNA topoisomerase [Bacillota bacterium]